MHDHLEILRNGRETWNNWRALNQRERPLLSGADLSELDLSGIDLSGADMREAELCDTVLAGANLKMVDLTGADLSRANLSRAALYKADLHGASLIGADLTLANLGAADLQETDLRGASLKQADLAGANLRSANLSEADLTQADLSNSTVAGTSFCFTTLHQVNFSGMAYGSARSMRGNYHGIRGVDSSYGNALFVRDAQDQDYLDNLEHRIRNTGSTTRRTWRKAWFSLWGIIDYGRSLVLPAAYAVVLALGYGLLYFMDMKLGWGWMDYSSSAESSFTPFYYSIVTYTTLGFGDITPKHWIGEALIVSEVILGYTTLGLLLSILANKVARRS